MDFEIYLGFLLEFLKSKGSPAEATQYTCIQYIPILGIDSKIRQLLFVHVPTFIYLPNNTKYNTKMESGFEDDFAPMQSSAGKTATIDDDSLILGDEDDSPKKTSDGKMWKEAKRLFLCWNITGKPLLP